MQNTVFVSHSQTDSGVSFVSFIKEIVTDYGFKVLTRGDLTSTSKITLGAIDELRSASIVIADLTDNNPTVLYEVGFAQSLDKPVLLVAERGSKTPFNIAAARIIIYSPEERYKEVRHRIAEAFGDIAKQVQTGTAVTIDNALAESQKKKKLFISYSHKDKLYLDRIMVHLSPLVSDGRIDLWVDTELRAGDKWKEDIERTLSQSSVVILLASADYLASEFVRNNELPQMLAAAEAHGTRILPLVLRPCRFARHESLRHFQSLNDPIRPISLLPEDEREVYYDLLAGEVEHYI